MILGAETIFPPSFYFFPYLLVYPFSQEFDAIPPATSVNCMHFRQRNHQIRCTYVYRTLPLRIYLSVYPLFKKEQKYVYSVYIFRQLYSRKACMKDSMPRAFFLLSPWKALCLPPFLYLIHGNICSNFVFFFLFSFCTSLRSKKNDTKNNIFMLVSWTSVNVLMILFRHFSSS